MAVTSDWEEVKRLAADFQRVQLSTTAQRLSDRNCIEIVNKLVHDKLIDVVHTIDGKEYLTPAQVTKEIRDELIFHGGRVNLVELQQALYLDFSHVEAKANDIVKNDRNLCIILGQIINREYLDHIAEEISDRLQELGLVTIAELTKQYDLPGDFLTETVEERLGGIIQGQMDPNDRSVIFTQAFVARNTAVVQGILSAITKPTPVAHILNNFKLQEKLFYNIVDDLVRSGRVKGCLVGGRQDKSSFTPDIYAKTQNSWVDAFYQQNGYLEYDALARLGIGEPRSFVKKRYREEGLLYLPTCCLGAHMREQLQASVDEALASNSWLDITPLLPSLFGAKDLAELVQVCLKVRDKSGDARVYCNSILVSHQFLAKCKEPFKELMNTKAQKEAVNAPILLAETSDKKAVHEVMTGGETKKDKREERRKKATGGSGSTHSGGGFNAREVKTKKSKKKGRAEAVDDSDDDERSSSKSKSKDKQQDMEFMRVEEIEDILSRNSPDCPQELITEMAEDLVRPLTKEYNEIARTVYLSLVSDTRGKDRMSFADIQDKINGLYANIKLFEKALSFFNGETQAQLTKYLLHTSATDMLNLLLNSVAHGHMLSIQDPLQLTPELRVKIISKLPDATRNPFTKLNKLLSGKSVEEFLVQFEATVQPDLCEIMLRKVDKKKERQLVFNHRQALVEQLRAELDPAMALHLATVLLFQSHTHCMVHVPGKCVPQLIAFLASRITGEQYSTLLNYQGLVQKRLSVERDKEEKSEEYRSVLNDLNEVLPKIKDIALQNRKSSNSEDKAD